MKYLLWLMALSLATPACAQKAKPHKSTTMQPVAKPTRAQAAATEPVLVVKRTPCHGTCPTYTAAVYADGRVDYNGERFVPLLGQHMLSLPVATVNQLLTEAKRINFSKLQDQYVGNTADLPATIITVHPVGQPAKTVHAQEGIPPALEGYVTLVNQQLDALVSRGLEK